MNKKHVIHFTALLAAVLALSACSKNSETDFVSEENDAYIYGETYGSDETVISMAASDSYSGAARSAAGNAANEASDISELPQGRKWVITMSISAETEDLDAALESVNSRIAELNGYIENQSISNGSMTSSRTYKNASMTIRIPSDSVNEFVQQVGSLTNVVSSSQYVTDITLSYSDTEGRISALQTEETRLLELMAMAEDMTDLLEIESRLTEVRYELETYSSRLRLYDNQVDYATVDLYLAQVTRYTPAVEPTFWEKVTDGLSDSLTNLGSAAADAAAWLLIDLPYLVVLGALCWGGSNLVRKQLRRRKAKTDTGKEASENK